MRNKFRYAYEKCDLYRRCLAPLLIVLYSGCLFGMQIIFLRESNRSNLPYRRHAIAYLGEFLELQRTTDLFSAVHSITEPIITDALNATDDMDVDSQSKGLSSKLL